MTEMDWEGATRNLLENVDKLKLYKDNEIALFKWRGDSYFGGIQKISDEIVLVSKTSYPLQKEFVEAIIKINPEITQLTADDKLDFTGRGHLLRRVCDRLTFMTPEQTHYMIENPINVIEYNPDLRKL